MNRSCVCAQFDPFQLAQLDLHWSDRVVASRLSANIDATGAGSKELKLRSSRGLPCIGFQRSYRWRRVRKGRMAVREASSLWAEPPRRTEFLPCAANTGRLATAARPS